MASGGWGPGPRSGQPGDNGPGGQGWGPPGPPANNPYGPTPAGGPYGPPAPHPYPPQNPYPYGQSAPAPARPQRRRSRLWYLSVPFLIGLVLRSAHRVATRLFVQEGDGRIEDRTVDRVQVARSVLGVVAALALILVYGVDADRWKNTATEGVANMIITPVLLLCTGPLVILGFILYAPSHLRPHLRTRLRAPLKAVGWYLLTVLVIAGVLYTTAQVVVGDRKDWLVYVMLLLSLAVMVWGFPFLLLASLYSARSAFNTAHVHPMLPPVLTGVLVWVLVVFNLIDSGMPEGPPVFQFCSLLGGPLSVTAVSLWELRRMRTRFGVTVRGGAGPAASGIR
ncbi:hypothetical protein [Streptomyces sp. NBC_00829]|uniref:hypothetical protein n=1 Tax=Streptomyces sp. NBC_00829 TaxID=2903679 RepID=UPI00386C4F9A|nr:hypothetical protein OG293_19330 [Streptomyces sp. NBC_00829]